MIEARVLIIYHPRKVRSGLGTKNDCFCQYETMKFPPFGKKDSNHSDADLVTFSSNSSHVGRTCHGYTRQPQLCILSSTQFASCRP